jgi:hypothetical protein
MNLNEADNRLFGLIAAGKALEKSCDAPVSVDFDLSSNLSATLLQETEKYCSADLRELAHPPENETQKGRSERLLQGREIIYARSFEIFDELERSDHFYGGIFRRRLHSYLTFLADRIRPTKQRQGPLDIYEGISHLKYAGGEHREEAIEIIDCKLNELFSRVDLGLKDYSEDSRDRVAANLKRLDDFVGHPDYVSKITRNHHVHQLANNIAGYVRLLEKHTNYEGIWGKVPFDFEVDVQLIFDHPGFNAWLSGDGKKYLYEINFPQLPGKKKNKENEQEESEDCDPIKIYLATIFYNAAHEFTHMRAISNLAHSIRNERLATGPILKSFTQKMVVTGEPLFDEFLAVSCPLVWGIKGGEMPADYGLIIWGRTQQKMILARAIEKALREPMDAATEFLAQECEANMLDFSGNHQVIKSMLSRSDGFSRHLTPVYSQVRMEAARLYAKAGEQGAKAILSDLIHQHHDGQTLMEELERRGKKYGYKPVCEPWTPPRPLSPIELRRSIALNAQPS